MIYTNGYIYEGEWNDDKRNRNCKIYEDILKNSNNIQKDSYDIYICRIKS